MKIDIARENMIKQQLRTNDVLSDSILDCLENTPRELFVPAQYRQFAFSDMHIPLDFGQTMMTPTEEGQLLQALALNGSETVLEIGTGSGYLTALLAKQAEFVYSLDYFQAFTDNAKQTLQQLDIDNVECITADAYRGWLANAPYDVIVIGGGLATLPPSYHPQLLPGGRIFALLGKSPVLKGQILQLNSDQTWQHELLFETDIAPLINREDKGEFVF